MNTSTGPFSSARQRAGCVLLLAASAAPAQWESDSVDRSDTPPRVEASAKPALSERRERLYRDMAASGNTLYKVGSITAWVGLGAFWGSFFIPNSGPALPLGMLAMWGGIPMMGAGADQMQLAATVVNPEAMPRRGIIPWVLYGAGLASQIGSIVVIGASLKEDADGDLTISPAAALTGLGLLLGGHVMHYVSWYQFSRRRATARIDLASWSVVPDFRLAEDGTRTAGARLAYRF